MRRWPSEGKAPPETTPSSPDRKAWPGPAHTRPQAERAQSKTRPQEGYLGARPVRSGGRGE